MRIYEIASQDNSSSFGILLYFEKEQDSVIILKDSLDEWTAPLLFAGRVKSGQFIMSRELTGLWIKERVIPSGRQNISEILANAHMASYDEMRLLELSKGRCSQDDLQIKRIDTMPAYLDKIFEHSLVECVPSQDASLLCFFKDGSVRKVNLKACPQTSDLRKLTSNDALFKSGRICAGGLFAAFDNSIDIAADFLYEQGIQIPLSIDDFTSFVQNNVLDASDSCLFIECSRQNLGYMVSTNQLTPIKHDVKGNLYLKGDVIRSRW